MLVFANANLPGRDELPPLELPSPLRREPRPPLLDPDEPDPVDSDGREPVPDPPREERPYIFLASVLFDFLHEKSTQRLYTGKFQ